MGRGQEDNEAFALQINDGLNSWTARVDVKASIALAIEAAALGFVITLATSDGPIASLEDWGRWTLGFGVGLIVLAIALAVLVVLPQLRSRATKKEFKDNFIYFGHLRHWNPKDLEKQLAKDSTRKAQLSRQFVAMAKIVWRKHVWLQWSLVSFMVGALLVGVTFLSVAPVRTTVEQEPTVETSGANE